MSRKEKTVRNLPGQKENVGTKDSPVYLFRFTPDRTGIGQFDSTFTALMKEDIAPAITFTVDGVCQLMVPIRGTLGYAAQNAAGDVGFVGWNGKGELVARMAIARIDTHTQSPFMKSIFRILKKYKDQDQMSFLASEATLNPMMTVEEKNFRIVATVKGVPAPRERSMVPPTSIMVPAASSSVQTTA